jgi:hypothetical protein
MKNRDLIVNKLEQIDGKLKVLNSLVRMGQSVDEFLTTLKVTEEILEEVKEYINREPISYT